MPLGAHPLLVAHRGVAQDFDRTHLTNETCTTTRMVSGLHSHLENTLPSMQAAFDYGADWVEIDLHPTIDGRFAVFHDWTLDCRTNGAGVTREQSLAYLQKLDVGYGYTADGGKTYPFRGKGVGMMHSLREVFNTFPNRPLILNIKSNDPQEGKQLAVRLATLSSERQTQIMVYGGERPVRLIRDRFPAIRTLWPQRLKGCLVRYFFLGWMGYIPQPCQGNMLLVPINYARWLWGWPNRFLQRMAKVDTQVFLVGPYRGEGFTQGLDDLATIRQLPRRYGGGIWTDHIETVGPAVKRSRGLAAG